MFPKLQSEFQRHVPRSASFKTVNTKLQNQFEQKCRMALLYPQYIQEFSIPLASDFSLRRTKTLKLHTFISNQFSIWVN